MANPSDSKLLQWRGETISNPTAASGTHIKILSETSSSVGLIHEPVVVLLPYITNVNILLREIFVQINKVVISK